MLHTKKMKLTENQSSENAVTFPPKKGNECTTKTATATAKVGLVLLTWVDLSSFLAQ